LWSGSVRCLHPLRAGACLRAASSHLVDVACAAAPKPRVRCIHARRSFHRTLRPLPPPCTALMHHTHALHACTALDECSLHTLAAHSTT
jgi:hypothetical protein